MRAVEPVVVVFEDARFEDGKRCVVGCETHIVVPAEQQVPVQSLEGLDCLAPVLHVHRHVSKMNENSLVLHGLVVSVQQHVVHLPDAAERPVAVLDDVRVAEMVVGDDVPRHVLNSDSPVLVLGIVW